MENLGAFILIGVVMALGIMVLKIIRNPDDVDLHDPGGALIEFGTAYPDEAVRAILMDQKGLTTFMRLADGKTGLAQALGNSYIIRLIRPGEVGVNMSDDGRGLILQFEEDSMIGGEYRFSTHEDAAEVSLWICGSFGLTMAQKIGNHTDKS